MAKCRMELCEYWGGDGRVCNCVLLDINEECGESISWWDGEYEGECGRPKDHEGDHFDGLSWWDDEGTDKTYRNPGGMR